MGHEFYGDLKQWTETAIAITKREIIKRGLHVNDNSSKKLKLSVDSAKGTFGFAVIRIETTLKAETSDGYFNEYIGDNRSPATIYRAADGAVMRAVAEMLRDPKIVEFLIED